MGMEYSKTIPNNRVTENKKGNKHAQIMEQVIALMKKNTLFQEGVTFFSSLKTWRLILISTVSQFVK